MNYWLVWLVITRVRQLEFDSLKAHHLVMTAFANA